MPDLLVIITVILFLFLVVTLLTLAYISGLFTSVRVIRTDDAPYLKSGCVFYYKSNKGSYGSLGSLFTETYSVAPNETQCAIYYDNDDEVGLAYFIYFAV